ncbi:glycosyltransferase family 4 protein [Flavobacterium selenitireducens]|uniref:glycosyltransferase family 4 protein n=1 Tax=Flavobacterium selenitireducens TaxID=2722704 RepID=UPI00168C017C|nr:glycosyltransferase family 4 protein [Flavobacterium selenitireducens]MBD3583426.1 glycosyltransferase family 4 protein [Flavobacterium selenitireducens]
MRVLQVIDSLEPGGAERMALNYAIALRNATGFSALAVTRKEGSLKQSVPDDLPYCFLDRNSTFDVRAIRTLRKFCRDNNIEWVHAHSTSWFVCVCLKLLSPSLKLIWHDHYGWSEFAAERKAGALKWASLLFSGIISVNENLKQWSVRQLKCRHVIYLPNFSLSGTAVVSETRLEGEHGKRILCLANLRPQKDHFMLIEAALKLHAPDWTFHLVGKDFKDDYAESVRKEIASEGLEDKIIVYGSRDDVQNIIAQSDICILTSASEGLPVALLEYGFMGKPVVVTSVGEVSSVIADGYNGMVCPPGDAARFADALALLIADGNKRKELGAALLETVRQTYSEQAVMARYTNWMRQL